MFRVSHLDGDVTDVLSVDRIEPVTRSGPLVCRCHIDEIIADPLPAGSTSRRWGVGIQRADGSVVIEHDRW